MMVGKTGNELLLIGNRKCPYYNMISASSHGGECLKS
jgi:hypothetical protein